MHGNADAISRLPSDSKVEQTYDEPDCFEIHQIETLPVRFQDLVKETAEDITLQPLLIGLRQGMPIKPSDRFGIRQEEFTLQNNAIIRGYRVVIPQKLQQAVLNELHSAHFGNNKQY
ncbi:hypothetical protein QE152_g35696 [Popillia japonica]|uniref:Uncharacterized protein n=1 Tax=Popillia japonica TaxID=7064 RepID=A0AAW1IF63_POPJA